MRTYKKVLVQLKGLRDEFAVLSKTKPDNIVNELKVGFVNERLRDANQILTGDHKPFSSFTEFNVEKLPSNSDVVVVLSQYLTALSRWRDAHAFVSFGKVHWRMKDGSVEEDSD